MIVVIIINQKPNKKREKKSMGEKAPAVKKGKKAVSQKTLNQKKINLTTKEGKVQCEFCKAKVQDILRHLTRCYRNPDNAPMIELEWDHVEDYNNFKEFLIKNPCTDKEREFNSVIAPNGNPFEQPIKDLLSYAKELPKLHKDKMLHQKMDEMFTKGIEVRLLNKTEYIERLKKKVRKGQHLFLIDWQKPITIEEIEAHQDELWDA